MQLKVLELTFNRECSTKNDFFHIEKDEKDREKFVFHGKKVHF